MIPKKKTVSKSKTVAPQKATSKAQSRRIKVNTAKLQQSEAMLRASESLLRTIAENYPNSYISIIEKDLTIGYSAGQEFKKQNLDPNQFVGLTLEQVFGKHTPLIRENYLKTFEGVETQFEIFINNQYQFYRTVPLRDQAGRITRILAVVENVTDRKQAESQREAALEKLREGEERLRLAVSAGRMGIWDRNIITGLLNWSVECKAMFGLRPETEVNDENFMNALHPDDRLPTDIAIREAQAKRTDFNTEYRVIWPDGTLHWIAALGRWYYDKTGQAIRMTGVTLDITERKRMEEALRISEERYRNFIGQSFEAISRTEFDHPIDITLPVEEQIDRIYENAFMAECNQAMADMYHVPSPEAFIGMHLIDAHGGKDDPINRETFRKLILNGYKSINDETKKYTVDGKPVWFLSNTIGIVENGYLVRLWGTAIDITERKRMEEEIEERTRFTNKLLEATALSTWISDAHGTAIQANPACYQFFGATEAEVIGKYNVFEDNVAEQQGVMPLIRHAYETGEPVTFFLDYDFGTVDHVKVNNSTHKFIKVMLTPILDKQGKVSHVVSQSIDLTEIKQSEDALRVSEERFRGLITSAPDAVLVVDENGKITFVNTEATNLLGYALDEFIGMDVENLIPQKSRKGHLVNRTKYMSDLRTRLMGDPLNLMTVHKDGSEIPVDIKLSPVQMDAGTQVITFMHDITERKRAEEKLIKAKEEAEESETRFRKSLEFSPTPIALADYTGKLIFLNQNFIDTYGYTLQDIPTIDQWMLQAYPDTEYRNSYLQQWEQDADYAFKNNTITPLRECQVTCKSGEVKTAAISAFFEKHLIIGHFLDISERKQTEAELLQANKALMKLHEMLREQSIRDPLTNLHNRRYLNEILEHEAARAQRENYPISFMLMDIDHFKNLNDTYGHSAGDKVLKFLSRLLVDSIRQGDIACRFGGEEFLVVMIGTHEADVERRAETIRSDFSRLRIPFENQELSATVSIGVAFYPKHGAEIQQVIGAADAAMYQAKQAGRNCVQVWHVK